MLKLLTTLSLAFLLTACGDKEAEDTAAEAEAEAEVSDSSEEESTGESEAGGE